MAMLRSSLFQSSASLSLSSPCSWWTCRAARTRDSQELGGAALRLPSASKGDGRELRLDREGLSSASSSLGRLRGPRNYGGLGQRHPQRWKERSDSYGEGAQIRATAAARDRVGFSSGEDKEEKVVSKITPMKVAVWLTIGFVLLSILDVVTATTVFNPRFWMYSSWILVIWPWPAAALVAIATLITAFRSSKRTPKEWEQVLLLLGSLTWLTLVPLGLFQGFVDGWPLILFTIYVGFFLISAVVRYRMHGDLESKDTDKEWETTPSSLPQIGFVACVVGGHWLAAFEAPFVLSAWTFDWKTLLAIATLVVAVLTHYYATYFLSKYFDRLVRPRAVVMFGPYRVVRHPIYSSYMLLFVGYCLALRSYKSLLLLLTVCIVYYEQRTKVEEEMLVDFFGELYETYKERVANKYFPLLY